LTGFSKSKRSKTLLKKPLATDLGDMTAADLAGVIRRREASPVEAVDAALAKIARFQNYNAFITVSAEEARRAALASMANFSRGESLPALFGVPFTVKDLTLTAGVRTTFGSRAFSETVPTEDSVAVGRLRDAGAILVGKTTTPEFGHKAFTEAPLFGRTLNPWNSNVTCGGSSGGAAVAALLGLGSLALGTDGGGSVRIPAACCGVVGLKATLGAIPNIHVSDMFASSSYVGPMARTVREISFALNILRGVDTRDPFGQLSLPTRKPRPVDGLRIAWLPNSLGRGVHHEVAEHTHRAVALLQTQGALVEEITLDFAELEPAYMTITDSALAYRFGPLLKSKRDQFDPSFVRSIENGLDHSAVDVQAANAERTIMFRKLQNIFEKCDLLLSPTLAAPPVNIGLNTHDPISLAGQAPAPIRQAWYPFTFPFNLSGHPALSMPCGFTSEGLPIGLQIAGPWHGENQILATAAALEEEIGVVRFEPTS
jgi:aspartyl-tRNA(Asn)/glutamyl-tRNA(Gln) amidotransferase subunit A